jgi:GMP synthase (glutamine-hydrolysing)
LVREEERACFAARLGVKPSRIHTVDVLAHPLDESVWAEADVLLVGGSGEYSVLDDVAPIRRFIDFLGETVERDVPLFASCFGFQALVLALGGEVIRDEEAAEVGTYRLTTSDEAAEDALFGSFPAEFYAQEGHKDRALRLPSGVINLASSELTPYQALRLPGRRVYATQFHPELTSSENRLRFIRYIDEYRVFFGEEKVQEILSSATESPHAESLIPRFVEWALSE